MTENLLFLPNDFYDIMDDIVHFLCVLYMRLSDFNDVIVITRRHVVCILNVNKLVS